MKTFLAFLASFFSRPSLPAPTPPVPSFSGPDGELDDAALTECIFTFWSKVQGEARQQSVILLAALRQLAPGAVGLHWAIQTEYFDDGYGEVISEVSLTVCREDGTNVTLQLPDHNDLHCEEFSYWSERDDIRAGIENALPEGVELSEPDMEARTLAELRSAYGLTGVTRIERLHMLGTLVACLIDLARVTDTGRLCVEQAVFDRLPSPASLTVPEPLAVAA